MNKEKKTAQHGREPVASARRTQKRPRPAGPTEEEIRVRAYEIFRQRMVSGTPGDAASDWVTAERELMGRNKKATRR
ncbi:MAG: DUF2934 domain-containing protein [Phycisphaerales bacterium]|nr:MAG: DUF2934 domain-containing protein [Phycisphaerales bacterium]